MVCRTFDISYLDVGHREVAARGMKRRLQLEYTLINSNRFLIVALASSFYCSVRESCRLLFLRIKLFGKRNYYVVTFKGHNNRLRQKRVMLEHICRDRDQILYVLSAAGIDFKKLRH